MGEAYGVIRLGSFAERALLSIRCPDCGACALARCVNYPSGEYAQAPHLGRRQRARADGLLS